jgi:hypothetical protein
VAARGVSIILSYFLAVGLLQVRVLDAADSTQSTPAGAQNDAADIEPGMKCLVTAALECEIKEVTEDKILIYITAIREAEQGVPMLSKVPYTSRLFQNVGVANVETRVVFSIPRDRIKQIVPIADNAPPKQEHVRQAVEHLKAAGLDEMARAVARQANQAACEQPLAELAEERNDFTALPQSTAGTRTEMQHRGTHQESPADRERPQVLVDLKVIEVSLTKLQECGSDFDVLSLSGLLPTKSSADQRGRDKIAFGILDRNSAKVLKAISRLQEAGLVKILAEPTLVTVSGRPATFRSGGEFPVLIPQSDGEVTVEFREYGTRVDLVPLDLGNGKLRLEIRPVISELDLSRSVTVGDTKVPGLRVRTVDAAFELMPGQTMAIAGLLQEVPMSADASKGDRKQETEKIGLIVLATPRLIEGAWLPPVSDARSSDAPVKPTLR